MLLGDVQKLVAFDGAALELADLRQLVADLRQAVCARDDFIAIVAHELRNPMTPILGVAELALAAAHNAEGTCPPRIMALMERMQHLVHSFTKRATRLLDVSRIETGNLPLIRSTTDLSSVVRSVAESCEALATRAHSPLTLDIQNDVVSLCNRLAVEQVVEYLLSNAFKFGSGKPIAVQLRSEGQSARLDIRDLGAGMSPDQQARIFAPFDQVMTQHRSSGFGIDLWVANRLVTAMDGRISMSSIVGEGSTFTVTFPLLPPAQDGTAT